jgi:hypothetical protein
LREIRPLCVIVVNDKSQGRQKEKIEECFHSG